MTTIRYPDPESVDEITCRFLPTTPVEFMPVLYGFGYDGECIRSECLPVDPAGAGGDLRGDLIHLRAKQLQAALGADVFGFGLVFVVSADQLDEREDNRYIPAPIMTAMEQLPGRDDVIVAVTVDASGRQWWAVVPRLLLDLEPVRIHFPAAADEDWLLDGALGRLWGVALSLDPSNGTVAHDAPSETGEIPAS